MLRGALLLVTLMVATTAAGLWLVPSSTGENVPQPVATARPSASTTAPPLAGVRIALDPGHQLGNHNFPREINRLVPAGGFRKACNTTGTATNAGFPEATFTWRVALETRRRLTALGATVVLTRARNTQESWGPCVNTRGSFGASQRAALTVSLHGDGSSSANRGFHVIVPTSRAPWTTDIARPSLRLGQALRAGLSERQVVRSTYVADALAVRSDLGTLNMSDVPIAMVELGNMRNASDARQMTSTTGQQRYAAGVVAGIRRYLGR